MDKFSIIIIVVFVFFLLKYLAFLKLKGSINVFTFQAGGVFELEKQLLLHTSILYYAKHVH